MYGQYVYGYGNDTQYCYTVYGYVITLGKHYLVLDVSTDGCLTVLYRY